MNMPLMLNAVFKLTDVNMLPRHRPRSFRAVPGCRNRSANPSTGFRLGSTRSPGLHQHRAWPGPRIQVPRGVWQSVDQSLSLALMRTSQAVLLPAAACYCLRLPAAFACCCCCCNRAYALQDMRLQCMEVLDEAHALGIRCEGCGGEMWGCVCVSISTFCLALPHTHGTLSDRNHFSRRLCIL